MERKTSISLRQGNQKKTVRPGSEHKSAFASVVIQKWHSFIDGIAGISKMPSGSKMNVRQSLKFTQALKRREKRFHNLFEHSFAAMLLIDPHSRRIVRANQAAAKFYGWSQPELEQMLVDDINTLPLNELQVKMGQALMSESLYFRVKHRLATGDVRSVKVFVGKVKIEGSDYLHAIIHDITEQVKAEEALLHSYELMKYIIEHNKSAVAVHDRDLKYLYVSQRYLDDYQVKEKDIIGKHHYEVFPDIPEKWREVHQKALNGVVSQSDEDLFERADGRIDWTRWECRPWYESDGSIGGIIIYYPKGN